MRGLVIRPLTEGDLPEADRINRIAFGTFFDFADPMKFRGDGDAVHGRFHANPGGAFAADLGGRLVACGFVMNWGGTGILGPLTVDVEYWGKGIARDMMEAMTGYMDTCGFSLQALFTHPQSAKHIRLYEQFGFWMQRVTAVMEKSVDLSRRLPPDLVRFSSLNGVERDGVLKQCSDITDRIYPGLDLSGEIQAIERYGFGDTIILRVGAGVTGFACCHQGAMSEAGSGQTVVKFAAVSPGGAAPRNFGRLVDACERFAALRGTTRLVAGTNTGRSDCYEALLALGFRTWMNGIAMMKPDNPGYNVPGTFVIDDWR